MPLKRTYSTSSEIIPSGGQFKRKKYPKRRKVMWPVNGTVGKPRPFPTRMVATLRYCETITISQALNTIGNYCFNCNSIQDPNSTGGGHQPYGHDTYQSIYNQYTVLKSKIKVTPTRFSSASNAITWGIGIEDVTTASNTYDGWAERPTYTAMGSVRGDGSTGSKAMMKYWDRKKRFPHEDTYRSLSAPFGASPAEVEVFNIVCQTSDTAASPLGTIYLFVEIDYTCEFYELKDLGGS